MISITGRGTNLLLKTEMLNTWKINFFPSCFVSPSLFYLPSKSMQEKRKYTGDGEDLVRLQFLSE